MPPHGPQYVYEKHFTVMNYRDPQRLKQINCEDFVPMFEAQYPDQKWGEIESRVCVALRQALEVSCFLGALCSHILLGSCRA